MADKKKEVREDLRPSWKMAKGGMYIFAVIVGLLLLTAWLNSTANIVPRPYVPEYTTELAKTNETIIICPDIWVEKVIDRQVQFLDFDLLDGGLTYEVMYNNDPRESHILSLGDPVPQLVGGQAIRSVQFRLRCDQAVQHARLTYTTGVPRKVLK